MNLLFIQLLSLSSITTICSGFMSPTLSTMGTRTNIASRYSTTSTTSLLSAKRKKRRRKDASNDVSSPSPPLSPATSPSSATSPSVGNDEDALPDFDLIEDIDLPSSSSSSTTTTTTEKTVAGTGMSPSPAMKKNQIDENDPAIIAAMKATKGMESLGAKSTKDLLRNRNRELEQNFVVNEIVEDVPSFAEYNAKKGDSSSSGGGSASTSGMGRKAMRREQRRAAALEAEGNAVQEEEGAFGQVLSKLPFIGNNGNESEKEEKSIIKVSVSMFQ